MQDELLQNANTNIRHIDKELTRGFTKPQGGSVVADGFDKFGLRENSQ